MYLPFVEIGHLGAAIALFYIWSLYGKLYIMFLFIIYYQQRRHALFVSSPWTKMSQVVNATKSPFMWG